MLEVISAYVQVCGCLCVCVKEVICLPNDDLRYPLQMMISGIPYNPLTALVYPK